MATAIHMHWMDEVSENPAIGAIEIWEIHNFTEDAHPLHIHHVQFEIVERGDAKGVSRGPEAWRPAQRHDDQLPGEIIRIKATVRPCRPVRLALPHPGARRQRDDAALRGRSSAKSRDVRSPRRTVDLTEGVERAARLRGRVQRLPRQSL